MLMFSFHLFMILRHIQQSKNSKTKLFLNDHLIEEGKYLLTGERESLHTLQKKRHLQVHSNITSHKFSKH